MSPVQISLQALDRLLGVPVVYCAAKAGRADTRRPEDGTLPASPDLGQALLSAELYRRTRAELRRADGSVHSALDLIHADMAKTLASLHDEVHALRQEVSALRAQVESQNALRNAVKRTVGLPVRAIRRIRQR